MITKETIVKTDKWVESILERCVSDSKVEVEVKTELAKMVKDESYLGNFMCKMVSTMQDVVPALSPASYWFMLGMLSIHKAVMFELDARGMLFEPTTDSVAFEIADAFLSQPERPSIPSYLQAIMDKVIDISTSSGLDPDKIITPEAIAQQGTTVDDPRCIACSCYQCPKSGQWDKQPRTVRDIEKAVLDHHAREMGL